MTDSATALHRLLGESLRAWRVPARAEQGGDGAICITGLGFEIRISRAAPGLPFRWMVAGAAPNGAARIRPAVSVIAVLRQVRQALDAGHEPQRLRIAASPLVRPEPGP